MLVIESKEGERQLAQLAHFSSIQHSDVVFYFYVTFTTLSLRCPHNRTHMVAAGGLKTLRWDGTGVNTAIYGVIQDHTGVISKISVVLEQKITLR